MMRLIRALLGCSRRTIAADQMARDNAAEAQKRMAEVRAARINIEALVRQLQQEHGR